MSLLRVSPECPCEHRHSPFARASPRPQSAHGHQRPSLQAHPRRPAHGGGRPVRLRRPGLGRPTGLQYPCTAGERAHRPCTDASATRRGGWRDATGLRWRTAGAPTWSSCWNSNRRRTRTRLGGCTSTCTCWNSIGGTSAHTRRRGARPTFWRWSSTTAPSLGAHRPCGVARCWGRPRMRAGDSTNDRLMLWLTIRRLPATMRSCAGCHRATAKRR